MNYLRLARLANLLDTVPAKQFDMLFWETATQADPIGWAARDPEFQAEGLKMVQHFNRRVPFFSNAIEWEAVCSFFDLTPAQADHLFWEYAYPTQLVVQPEHVAKRIRHMLVTAAIPQKEA